MIQPLLTGAQVAKILGISQRTFLRLVESKRLLGTRVSPGKWAVQESILQKYIEENTEKEKRPWLKSG